jgi:membrane-associated phospholipid phosphatase
VWLQTIQINSAASLRAIVLLTATSLVLASANAASPGPEIAPSAALPDAPSALRPTTPSAASTPNPSSTNLPLEQQDHPPVTIAKLPLYIAHDAFHIIVSPSYIRTNDLKWLLPLAGASAVAFATDTHTMTQVVSSNPSFNQTNIDVSNSLAGGLIAVPVALFGVGTLRHEERPKETGVLGSEAMIDAFAVDQIIKLCTFRERPNVDGSQGEFYIGKSGVDSSFVSAHSIVAWSSAAVIAGEYPSRWVQVAVYSLSAGVSITRVMGQQHFPSDVLLGAAGGWLIGHYVFRAHHHLPLQHTDK